MGMREEYRGKHFCWNYDDAYGVGSFQRLADGAMSPHETGPTCQNRRREFRRLQQKTASPHYPKAKPSFAEAFDAIAAEYIFAAAKGENCARNDDTSDDAALAADTALPKGILLAGPRRRRARG